MKIIIGLILILNFNLSFSQDIQLLNFEKQDTWDYNCDLVSNCINSINHTDSILSLRFIIKDNNTYFPDRKLNFNSIDDTLQIGFISDLPVRDSLVYNDKIGNYDTLRIVGPMSISCNPFVKGCMIYSLSLKTGDTYPKYITYNSQILEECPTGYIDYKIYKTDTIDIIDSKGFKEGKWIDFYDNGEIQKITIYKRDNFVSGIQYDKEGNSSPFYWDGCLNTNEKIKQ